ncbi:Hypothetical predicted protein, partial [Pelobates cultripes]
YKPSQHYNTPTQKKQSPTTHRSIRQYSDVVREGITTGNKHMPDLPKRLDTLDNQNSNTSPPPDTPPSPSFFRRDLIQNRRKPIESSQFWEPLGKRQRSLEGEGEGEREERKRQHQEKRGKTSI